YGVGVGGGGVPGGGVTPGSGVVMTGAVGEELLLLPPQATYPAAPTSTIRNTTSFFIGTSSRLRRSVNASAPSRRIARWKEQPRCHRRTARSRRASRIRRKRGRPVSCVLLSGC